jgi:small subunit ribosomal protein S6
MPLYEHVFMARQDVTPQQVETMIDQYRGVIEQNGGTIAKTEQWGVKSLAYRIKKNRKAHFALFNLDAPPAAVAEMERQMRISEDILRFMTVRVDAFEDGPSVMMQKRDRDERKDRERGRDRDGDGEFGGRDRDDRRDRERPRRSDGEGGGVQPAAGEV